MGLLTLQNFRDDLNAALGQTVSNTLLDRWVNQSLKEFGYAFKFHELEALASFVTTANVGTYLVTGAPMSIADLRHLEDLRRTAPNTALGRIIPETRSRYLKRIGDTATTSTYGVPRFYHKYGASVYFRPICDATLYTIEVDYFKRITNLAAAGDVTPFIDDWDEVTYVGALYRGFRHFGEFDRYQNVRNDFLGLVRSRSTEFDLEEFPEGGISPLAPSDTEESLETEEAG